MRSTRQYHNGLPLHYLTTYLRAHRQINENLNKFEVPGDFNLDTQCNSIYENTNKLNYS